MFKGSRTGYMICLLAVLIIIGILFYPVGSPTAAQDENGTDTLTPSTTPTLAPRITRTPGAAQPCPARSNKQARIILPTGNSLVQQGSDGGDEVATGPILDYLNSTGTSQGLQQALESISSALSNGPLHVRIFNNDVTGDGVPDVILDITFEYMERFLVVFGCLNGHYATLYNHTYLDESAPEAIYPSSPVVGVQAIRDMNGDGVAEIVLNYVPVRLTVFYAILEWNGTTFVNLVDQAPDDILNAPSGISMYDGYLNQIRDRGDGTEELVLITARQRDTRFRMGTLAERKGGLSYAWNGVHFTYSCFQYIEPEKYMADALMDGANESACRHFSAAIADYQRVIFDRSLLPWNNADVNAPGGTATPVYIPDEHAVLEAFARYQIIVLHAVQNQPAQAAADMKILAQKYGSGQPGSDFVGLAQAFMDSYATANQVSRGCASAVAYATAHPDILSVFSDYIFESSDGPGFPLALSDSLQRICPFT